MLVVDGNLIIAWCGVSGVSEDMLLHSFLAQTHHDLSMSWCVQYHTIELLLQQYQTDCELLVKLVM